MKRLILLVGLAGVIACGGALPGLTSTALTPVPGRALSGTEGQSLVLTPVMAVRRADPLGWAQALDRPRDYMRHTDTLLETQLSQRATHTQWVFPEMLERERQRNPGYMSDPYSLSGAQLLPGVYRIGEPLQEPLAGELRSLISFQENARYVLIPVEIHFISVQVPAAKPGDPPVTLPHVGRGVLRMALYDARATMVLWQGDVIGDTVSSPTGAMESVARRLGDILGS